MNIKNDLRDTTILFMKACLKVMSEDPIKIVAFEKIMIDGDEYRIETEGRPNYLSAYVAHQNEIETLPETRNLTRLLKEIESVKNAIEIDTDNRELALGVNAWMWLNFRYFHHLLTLYFNAGGTTSFSKDAFDSSYEELDRHVFGSTTISRQHYNTCKLRIGERCNDQESNGGGKEEVRTIYLGL